MRYESLVSVGNLGLAWRRINTGRNNQYKRFFRPLYLGYEAGLRPNLRLLHDKLQAGWQPHSPTRIYLPKPSGLQRPITLLQIEDQIVLQAIANVVAISVEKRRRKVELRTVFSNVLNVPNNTIFFVHRWQETYARFQEVCLQHFNDGYRWIAHFDLAAYYDTISHEQLIRLAAPRTENDKTCRAISEWLRVWTAADGAPQRGHGIPQGPIASNFLAEAFFLPIDEQMTKLPVRYMRYVDDIRIFAKTRSDVQAAAVQLEQACRNHGLIPQGKKFAISEASSLTEAMGQLPSIPPEGDRDAPPPMDLVPAEQLMRTAINPRPLSVKDKSRLRYVLYRAPASRRILAWVLKLLDRHPEYIDEFAHYLSNYASSGRIQRVVANMLQSAIPYGYVRGELWHILARIGTPATLSQLLPVARNDARKRGRCVAWSWGLVNFFMRCDKSALARSSKRLQSAPPLARALLTPTFSDSSFQRGGLAAKMITSGTLEESIAIALAMRSRRLRLTDIGLRHSDVCQEEVQHVMKGLGVIRRRRHPTRDYVGETLASRFAIPARTYWQSLLKDGYEYALQILLEAEGAFDIDKSHWLQLQNSLNDLIVRRFISYLAVKGLPGVVATTNKHCDLVDLGVVVQTGSAFDQCYPALASGFRDANWRRNRLPGSHPYDKKGGHQNKFLTKKERDRLRSDISAAYGTIVAVVDANGVP